MPPAWLTTFPLLERDRLVALLQESSAPLFGEMVPYAITLVYPAPEAAVRVGPSPCVQARSLLSTAPATLPAECGGSEPGQQLRLASLTTSRTSTSANNALVDRSVIKAPGGLDVQFGCTCSADPHSPTLSPLQL